MAIEHTFTLTEPEMMQTSFDKPRITISGLRIPQMPTKDVLAELRCIPHLKKLRSVKMDDIHNCVVLISEDKDTGYMAAAYLAARHGGVYRDDLLNVSELAEDKFEDDPFDAGVFEPDEEFLQEGCLPIYPLCPSQNIFEEMGERGPDGDDHVTIRRGRRRKVQNWAEADSAHPILIIPNIITYNAVPKIEAQHNMRSLTIVLLHRPKKNRTNTEDYDSSGLAEELRFACAAEVVDLTTPAPDCQYNQAIFTQSLAAHGMKLAPDADAGAMLRRLEQYRERRGGAGNRNIVALARLLAIKFSPCPQGLTTDQVLDYLQLESEKAPEQPKIHHSFDLCGCENVKTQLRSVVDSMRMERRRRDAGLPTSKHGPVLLFAGAPGTGKTTAAQMLCEWMEESLLLETGFGGEGCFQISGAQLKGRYVGQTAPLVHQLFQEHSFLFIDEAYALAEAGKDNDHYAQEAMAQLCIELENLPDDHVVVFAGYGGKENRMRAFLDANPGLASRITTTVQFNAYSPDKELPAIFAKLAADKKLTLPKDWEQIAVSYFTRRAAAEDYGSGREARRLLESCLTAQAHRLAGQLYTETDALCALTADDLSTAIAALERGFTALNSAKAARYGL